MEFKTYDEATLKKLQKIELSILKDFIDLCERHNLIYFGWAGTAIGALRHQGFIPWDDDIDVGLPRKDYEKFLKIAAKEYGDKYTIMNAENDENYPLMTTRWMLKGTEFREEALKDVACDLGIFLDVYAFDYGAKDEKAYKWQALQGWFWSKILILYSVPEPYIAGSGWVHTAEIAVCKLVHKCLHLFGFKQRSIYKCCKRAMMAYAKAPSDTFNYMGDTRPYMNEISRDELFPLRKEQYEDIELYFPGKVENMLTRMYGDFMQLPPEDKRKNHYPYKLEFGPYGEEEN